MKIGYLAIREHFTTRVTLNREKMKILVEYIDGPFSRLENVWTFADEEAGTSRVDFFIDYEFRNRMLGVMMGSMFDVRFPQIRRRLRGAGGTRSTARQTFSARHSSAARSSKFSACSTEASRIPDRPRSPNRRSTVTRPPFVPAQAKCTRPTGFSAVPPPGPATPVMLTATLRPGMRERAPRHRDRRRLADRAVRFERGGRHVEQFPLGLVRIGHEAALENGGGAGNFRQQAGDEAAGAGFRGRDFQAQRSVARN